MCMSAAIQYVKGTEVLSLLLLPHVQSHARGWDFNAIIWFHIINSPADNFNCKHFIE